jgi:hypothetical protein
VPITRDVNSTALKRRRLAAAVLALALLPAGTADAATKHRKPKAKKAVATKVATANVALAPSAAVATPAPAAPAAAQTVTSVISIGGYVFYNLTYAEAVEAYAAAVAAAPAGYVPPAVTSISVNTTVGGNA